MGAAFGFRTSLYGWMAVQGPVQPYHCQQNGLVAGPCCVRRGCWARAGCRFCVMRVLRRRSIRMLGALRLLVWDEPPALLGVSKMPPPRECSARAEQFPYRLVIGRNVPLSGPGLSTWDRSGCRPSTQANGQSQRYSDRRMRTVATRLVMLCSNCSRLRSW